MTVEMKAVYAALAKAQSEMTRAHKGAENPHFRKSYADLTDVQDACMPALQSNGFAVIQPLVKTEHGTGVMTILAHESGGTLETVVPLLLEGNNMQKLGSAITYARRYGLMCMTGVAPDDDDANAAVVPARSGNPPKAFDAPPPDEDAQAQAEARKIEDARAAIMSCTTIEDLNEMRDTKLPQMFGSTRDIPHAVRTAGATKRAELEGKAA